MNTTAQAPFLVQGEVNGHPVEHPAHTIAEAERLTQITAATSLGAWASWLIQSPPHSPEEAGPVPVILFGRTRAGLTGETRRIVHTFALVSGYLLAPDLTATCGTAIRRAELDLALRLGTGAPCERCLSRLPSWPQADPDSPLTQRVPRALSPPTHDPAFHTGPGVDAHVLNTRQHRPCGDA